MKPTYSKWYSICGSLLGKYALPASTFVVLLGSFVLLQAANRIPPGDVTLQPIPLLEGVYRSPQFFCVEEIPGKPGFFLLYEQHSGSIKLYSTDVRGAYASADFCRVQPSSSNTELGSQSIAFHPKFTENGKYYLFYTLLNPRRLVVEERQTDTSLINDRGVSKRIMSIPQPEGGRGANNGGQIAFSNDGMLYICTGDANAEATPEMAKLLGKVLRINVDAPATGSNYSIPKDNPFINSAEIRPEVWASGLRSPRHGSFDQATGDLWVGDIGAGLQEINLIRRGENMGWPVMNGTACITNGCDQAGLTLPVKVINNTADGARWLMGGYVFRGDPACAYYGIYICADRETKSIFALAAQGRTAVDFRKIGTAPNSIEALLQDSRGNLYLVIHGAFISKIVHPDMKPR
jgi:hypothetical protein